MNSGRLGTCPLDLLTKSERDVHNSASKVVNLSPNVPPWSLSHLLPITHCKVAGKNARS